MENKLLDPLKYSLFSSFYMILTDKSKSSNSYYSEVCICFLLRVSLLNVYVFANKKMILIIKILFPKGK